MTTNHKLLTHVSTEECNGMRIKVSIIYLANYNERGNEQHISFSTREQNVKLRGH